MWQESLHKIEIKASLVMNIGSHPPRQSVKTIYRPPKKNHLYNRVWFFIRMCAKVFENVLLHTHARKFLRLLL
nr:MAG TPA: hypothetical protein [Caudoviricetes sp.]